MHFIVVFVVAVLALKSDGLVEFLTGRVSLTKVIKESLKSVDKTQQLKTQDNGLQNGKNRVTVKQLTALGLVCNQMFQTNSFHCLMCGSYGQQ
jgi:hypothetical protein